MTNKVVCDIIGGISGGKLMYADDYRSNGFFVRRLFLKILLMLFIIVLLIWILPKFISYKPSNKIKGTTSIQIKEKNISNDSVMESLQKLKDAAFLYYSSDKLPIGVGDIELVTLKQLIDDKLITDLYVKDKKCDVKKSYAKITKLDDDYLLKVFISYDSKTDYLLVHVGEYSYCNNAICEKNDVKGSLVEDDNDIVEDKTLISNDDDELNNFDEDNIDEENEDDERESSKDNSDGNSIANVGSSAKLSEFSEWSSYYRTTCDIQPVTCALTDKNCLKEVQITKKIEQVENKPKSYTTNSLVLKFTNSMYTNVCKNYNYVTIQGNTYRTLGNYDEILNMGIRMSTNSWTYKGVISTSTTPSFGGNKYYKFVGADYSNCSQTCLNGPKYYYDVYEYNYGLVRVSSVTEGCSNYIRKNINSYIIAKQLRTVTRNEVVNGEVCYARIRTRNLIN